MDGVMDDIFSHYVKVLGDFVIILFFILFSSAKGKFEYEK
jgi:hypothetical protein